MMASYGAIRMALGIIINDVRNMHAVNFFNGGE